MDHLLAKNREPYITILKMKPHPQDHFAPSPQILKESIKTLSCPLSHLGGKHVEYRDLQNQTCLFPGV